ncbi:hypothetical protein BJI48_05710 [Helicobacter sp. 11S02596-1]|nr:hypothetical protein BJI48_05710 [Helicobacter sp. 11S02596-1]
MAFKSYPLSNQSNLRPVILPTKGAGQGFSTHPPDEFEGDIKPAHPADFVRRGVKPEPTAWLW